MNIQAELDKIAEKLQSAVPEISGNYIKTKQKVFTLPDGTMLQTIDCIILDSVTLNTLMPPYQPNSRQAALCAAIGRDPKTMGPSKEVTNPQSDVCITCPKNQWGSNQNGKTKACSNKIRLAVVPPDAGDGSPIWFLTITPSGLGRWASYYNAIVTKHGKGGLLRVVTEVSFVKTVDYPTLQFKELRIIEDNNLATIIRLHNAADQIILTNPHVD